MVNSKKNRRFSSPGSKRGSYTGPSMKQNRKRSMDPEMIGRSPPKRQKQGSVKAGLSNLSEQILYMIDKAKLTEQDVKERRHIVRCLENIKGTSLDDKEFEIYGSFNSGLSLFFSDVDLRLKPKEEYCTSSKTSISSSSLSNEIASLKRQPQSSYESSDSEDEFDIVDLANQSGPSDIDNMMLNFFSDIKPVTKKSVTIPRGLERELAETCSKSQAQRLLRKLEKSLKKRTKPFLRGRQYEEELKRFPLKHLVMILKCRVPIINIHTHYGFQVDISVKEMIGSQNTEPIVKKLSQYLFFKELALIFKLILQRRSLNKSFTGGLSSFYLYVLIGTFLIHHEENYQKLQIQYAGLNMTKKQVFKQELLQRNVLGELFLSFLLYCRSRENFSRNCLVEIEGYEVDYKHLQKISKIRNVFNKVYEIVTSTSDLARALSIRDVESMREYSWALNY